MDEQRSETPMVPPCSDCACHCHSLDEDIPPGHLDTCAFADPDYMPGDFIPGDEAEA